MKIVSYDHVPAVTELTPLALAAKQYLLAKSEFNKQYITHWHGVEPCNDELGFKLLETFRAEIKKYVFDLKRGDEGVKNAAREMFRLVAVGQADYTFAEACSFVKWYEKLKHRIGRGIGDLYDYHGDSFGDLIDSYPLAGKELVLKALATDKKSGKPKRDGFLEEREVTDAVLEKHGLQWHKFITEGENYIESALETAARNAYLRLEILGNEVVFPTPEEQSAVDYAGHFDD